MTKILKIKLMFIFRFLKIVITTSGMVFNFYSSDQGDWLQLISSAFRRYFHKILLGDSLWIDTHRNWKLKEFASWITNLINLKRKLLENTLMTIIIYNNKYIGSCVVSCINHVFLYFLNCPVCFVIGPRNLVRKQWFSKLK